MIGKQTLVLFGSSLALSFVMVSGVQARKPPPPTDPPSGGGELTAQERLGEFLFKDAGLSEPTGQSCESCHDPAAGFADPDTGLPVSEGVIPGRFGTRNSPSAGYTAFTPTFATKRGILGGQFWDGRAANLAAQARGPFLNPVEMANTTKGQVIGKVQSSNYAALFNQVCGANAFLPANVEASYVCLSEAIAAYEGTGVFSPFTSKFDAVQAGKATFDAQQQRGWGLFTGNAKCAHCHIAKVGAGSPILFTDFKYHNVGLPENRDVFDLVGAAAIDLGLGGFLNDPQQYGKFKDPHLRNIAVTPPYMHNGVLWTLKEVVHFYNTRDVLPVCDPDLGNTDPGFATSCWAEPEIPETMDSSFLGNLNLTEAEEDAIVAFLETLTDGYTQP
jgi:cytochrome c peroxidase